MLINSSQILPSCFVSDFDERMTLNISNVTINPEPIMAPGAVLAAFNMDTEWLPSQIQVIALT